MFGEAPTLMHCCVPASPWLLLGDQWDATFGYQWRDATLEFLTGAPIFESKSAFF